ncbi:MAG: hypothetical protein QOH40_1100 [Arthrobacter pascens]|nr:hypothetical protein [Arthrobacter pascens]
MSIGEFSAVLTCVILTGLAVFQGALIAGAPLGRMAWGGQHNVLPPRLRIASAASIATYALFAYIALAKANFAPSLINESFTAVLAWVLTAYFTVGVLLNGISRSKSERQVMTPLAFILAALYLTLALN